MESLFPPNTPEAHVYASIYTALDEVRHKNEGTERPTERQLYGAEFRAALDVLGAHNYDLPDKITFAWMLESPLETAIGVLRSVEVCFIHFTHAGQTTAYVFTKDADGQIFCDKEILQERQVENLEKAGLEYLLEDFERDAEVTTEEISILSEMMGAVLSTRTES